MALTNKGVPYPVSSDNIAPLETHFANLANSADNVGIVSGSQGITGPTTDTPVTITVTFPTAFLVAPKVVVNVQNAASGSPYVCNITANPTTTAFTVKVHRLSGTTAESLKLVWMASTFV